MTELYRRFGGGLGTVLLALVAIWLAGMVLAPNVMMIDYALRPSLPPSQIGGPNDVYSLDNILYLATESVHRSIFLKTVWASGLVTLITFVICYPLAYWLAQNATANQTAVAVLALTIPFWINEVLRTLAWYILLAFRGPLNTLFLSLGVIDEPMRWYGDAGVMAGMAYAYILFMLFPIYNAIESLEKAQIEAARDLGASVWRIHRRVVIPHAKAGIATGCVFTFMLAAGSYVVPALLGSPGSRAHRQGQSDGGGEMSAADRILKSLFGLYMAAFFLYLFAPLAIMAAATFNTSRFPTITPWQGTTLQWFSELWADAAMWKALWTSIIVAFFVVIVVIPIGTAAALVLTSLHARARSIIYAVMVSPLLTPGVVIGISTLILWRQLNVGGGLFLIVVAQASFIICYVMLMVAARLQRFDRTQEEAAIGLGASRFMVFRRITLPFLKPALFAAGFLAVLQSIENYNTTLFVRGFDTPLTVFIATKVRTGLTPAVNALALIMISLTILGAIAYEVVRRRSRNA